MKVIIAEKPSVAREIAAIVGAKGRKDGFMEGNGYAVTWAFGHLVGPVLPHDYGFEGFRAENLPILPDPFIIKPRQIRKGKDYADDPGAVKQLKVIGELFAKAERIIVATDAGREGELIFRYIYNYLGCKVPFDRLWISSLTDTAIRDGLLALRPGKEYDKLYHSAKARSEADWLVGINASQALSIAAGRGVWSLGRVQTPTLALICARYLENTAFKPQTYFQLKLHTAGGATVFAALSADRFDDRPAADGALAAVNTSGSVTVAKVERKQVQQQPPLPYDLTTLQKEANSRHGFSADKTLSLAQALYEAKLITYPRTGSRYIPEDVYAEIKGLIAKFKGHPRFGDYVAAMEPTVGRRPVDGKKVTDHHAILPTGIRPGELTAEERTLYEMIVGRMLESFSPPCVKDNTAVTLDCAGLDFTARGSVTINAGWRAVFNQPDEEKEDDATILPDLTEGESLPVRGCEVLEKQTRPRPLHTEGSLLAAMETAGKDLDDEAHREAMKMASKRGQSEFTHDLPSGSHFCKESGLGTPATRAAIIETLFSREYIKRDKKSLVPTDKGMAVYDAVKDKMIADAAMTGSWELALAGIASGEVDPQAFHRSIEVYASQITSELLEIKMNVPIGYPTHACPKCKTGTVVLYPNAARCGDQACGLVVWRKKAQKDLTDAQIIRLLDKGRTGVIDGFQNKTTGKIFSADVVFDGDFATAFDFTDNKDKGKGKGKKK